MKIYLTEYIASNKIGRVCKMAGLRIEAENLEEAEEKSKELGVTVIGEWHGDDEDWDIGDIQERRDEAWLKEKTDEPN